jgi:hypothetical protein
VLGGSVTGNAVITDNATVWNGTVSGSATVGALTQWNDNLNISGSAVVKAVKDVQGILSPAGTSFSGTVQMLGAVEEYFSPGPTSGVYFDFLPESDAGQAAYGGNLTAPPVEVTAPIQIGSTAQTITLATVPAQAAGSYYALTASASSGLPVGLFSQTPTVCTVAGSVVDAIASGTCTLLASQPGNTTYAAAPTVTSSFTVNAANSQTITFPAIPAQIVGTQLPLYAWASSSLAVTFTSQTSNTCTVSGTTLTMVATGNCSVTAAQSGNGAYSAAAPVAQTFAIVPQLAQSIIFPPVATVEVAIGNSYSPVVEATSGLPVTLTSQTTSICTISGEAINLIAAGTCTVTATQPGNAFYQAAPAVTVSFPISGLRPQIIVFPLIPTQAPGVTVNLSAVTNSAQAITYSSSTPSVCTVTNTGNNATGTVTTIVAGTCTVTAAQPGGWVYAAATPVTQSFTVTSGASFTLSPASASLTIAQGNSTTDAITVTPVNGFGGAVTFSTELLPANMTATFSPNPTSSKSAQMTLGVQTAVPGTYTFNVIGISGSLAASIPVTVVATGTQTITFPQIGTQQLGATIWLNASVSSGNVAYFVSSTPSICSVSGSSATMLAVGTCTIVAEQGANGLYTAAANVSNSFQVVNNPTPQTISFAAIGTQTVGTPLTLTATASSNLAVTYSASPSTVCSVSGTTATFVGAGTCTITATQTGNSTYAAATPVSQMFTVNGEPQTIAFGTVSTQTVGTPLTLAATTSSNLAVTYTASPSTVCTVSGTTATFVGAGTCTITATQPGNSTYSAATAVSQTFTVKSNQSFALSLSSPSVTILSGGQGATDLITVTPAGGFSSAVTLSATLPQGISDAFVQPGNVTSTNALFVLAAGASVKPGAYVIPIGGASGSLTASVNLNVTVTGTQTITFGTIAAQTVGTPLSLGATASSNLAVSYSASPATVCTVSGTTATFVGAGSCTITASQAGNSYYSAATSVSQSFTVKATGPSFTLTAATATLSQVPGAATGVTDAISIVPANGFTGTVTFTVSGIPAGVDYAFTSTSSTTGTTFVIYVPAGVAASNNNKIVITGTSGAITAQTTITLNIP